MGTDSSSINQAAKKIMRTAALKAALFMILCGSLPVSSASEGLGEQNMHKTAEQFISDFRQGKSVTSNDDITGLANFHHVDKSSLFVFRQALRDSTSDVREKIVDLLCRMALKANPPNAEKLSVIQEPDIIRALLIEGFAKDDSAANAAELILREKVRPSDLRAFSEVYIKSLQKGEGDYLYLIAKAKVMQAKPLVDNLARSKLWQEDESRRAIVKIVQASLGNAAIEHEFINAVYEEEKNAPPAPKNRYYDPGDAKDGKGVAEKIGVLGLIGTLGSLREACRYLRSPLKSYVPNVKERSVRYDALSAIRYNFPDERALLSPVSVNEWAAAERFCTINLGVVFEGPTPVFPPDQAYPMRLDSVLIAR